MPDVSKLVKAKLLQLDSTFTSEMNPDRACVVQFNPESLKVTFANHLVQPPGTNDQGETATRQFVGAGTTKLALTLWFDVGSPQSQRDRVDDVRKLTEKVAYFISPVKDGKVYVPPAVRFEWGSFQFDGLMESMDETLEFFSPDGRPLRASVALGLSQQKFQFKIHEPDAGIRGGPGGRGTQPLARAASHSSVQGLADAAGVGGDWQSIAAANGIENARSPGAGALLDLDLRARRLGDESGGLVVAPPPSRVI